MIFLKDTILESRMFLNKRILSLLLFLLISFAAASYAQNTPSKLTKVTLQLNWKYHFEFAGFIAAKEKGFFKKNGLNVELRELKNPKADVIKDVLDGKSDFGIGSSYIIYNAAKGKNISAILPIFQHTPARLIVLKSSGIRKLKDLNNKKISIADKYIFVEMMLKINGIKYIKEPLNYSILKKQADAMISYSFNIHTNVEKNGLGSTIDFNPIDYGIDGYDDILFTSGTFAVQHSDIVKKMKKAVIEGWRYAFKNPDEIVNLIYKKYNSLHKSKKELYYEVEQIKTLSGYLEGKFGSFDINRIKNTANMYLYVMPGKYNMDNLNNFIFEKQSLTEKEVNYLLKKKQITMCVYKKLYPLEAVVNGKYIGMLADLMDEFQKQLPIPFKLVAENNPSDMKKAIAEKKCDILPAMVAQYSPFSNNMNTVPYLQDHLVVITSTKTPYIPNLRYFKKNNGTLLVRFKSVYNYLKHNYPFLRIRLINNTSRIFDLIKHNKNDGFVAASIVANNIIKMYGYKEFKVNAEIRKPEITGGIGVSKDNPILFSIFKKLSLNIPKNKIEEISEKYNLQVYTKKVNYKYLWIVIDIFGVFVVIFIIISLFYSYRNAQLKKLLDTSISGMIIHKNQKIIMANRVALSMLGWNSIDELENRNIFEFVHGDDYQMLKKYTKNHEFFIYEAKYIKKDGAALPVLAKGSNLDSKTRIVSFVDLSKLKKAQTELEEINKTLEKRVKQEVEKNKKQQLMLIQQNRLAQMGEIISMIAHQWRQPLNIISLAAQKVLLRYKIHKELDKESLSMLEKEIPNQLHLMSNIINDFRTFFKPEKDKTVFDIQSLVNYVTSLTRPALNEKKITVDIDAEENLFVKGFFNELGQSLVNIINNAKDALEKQNIGNKKITISAKKENDKIVLSIEDNAGGIPENIINKIFDPYFSTKSKEGTGLGLYMAKIIVEEHMGGELTVENSDKGAVFKIVLKAVNNI